MPALIINTSTWHKLAVAYAERKSPKGSQKTVASTMLSRSCYRNATALHAAVLSDALVVPLVLPWAILQCCLERTRDPIIMRSNIK
jgi:hypothetical protein